MADNLRTPLVRATVRGAELAVSEVIITNPVNGLASIQLGGHSPADAKATSQSAELPAELLARRSGALQNYVLNTSRLNPDMAVAIADGNGHVIRFSGFLTSPSFGTSANGASLVFAGVHAASVLKFFNSGVYSAINRSVSFKEQQAGALNPQTAQLAQFSTDSAVAMLGKVLESYEAALKALGPGVVEGDATSVELVDAAMQRNSVVLPLVLRFISESVTRTRMPGVRISGFDPLARSIRKHLGKLLSQETDFISMVQNNLLADFGLQLVCRLDGSSPGARLELISYVNATPLTLAVRAENFNFTAGGVFDLPIKGVVVRGYSQPGPLLLSTKGASATIPGAVAAFPPNASLGPGGRIIELNAPEWLDNQSILPSRIVGVASGITTFRTKWKTAAETLPTLQGETVKLLNWWARTKFAYHSLASARATVTCPLDARIETGRVYSIRVTGENTSAAQLFQGYAANVTHRLATHGALVASTTVEFSHVQAQGFVQAGDRPS